MPRVPAQRLGRRDTGLRRGTLLVSGWFVGASLLPLAATQAWTAANQQGPSLASVAAVLLAALATSYAWHRLFAVLRQRPLDGGWLMHGWLLALLLPATLPVGYVVYAVTIGVVLGALVFGGSGHYLVSPALLGAVVVSLSYPDVLGPALSAAGWQALVAADTGWLSAAIAQPAVAAAGGSALACYAAGVVLCGAGVASPRVLGGALFGVVLGSALVMLLSGTLLVPVHWQWILGYFPFCAALIATDPTAAAATPGGRLAYGTLFGLVAVVVRELDPAQPDAAFTAALVAMLSAPLLDRIVPRLRPRALGANSRDR
ncbi:MAG: RnfABCDGE type electron transport complex subunit D [Pseudomonadota bacterium]